MNSTTAAKARERAHAVLHEQARTLARDELLAVIEEAQADISAAHARQTVALAHLSALEPVRQEDGTTVEVHQGLGHQRQDAPDLAAPRMGVSTTVAANRVMDAIRQVTRTPKVVAAMAAGELDLRRAAVITEGTEFLDADDAAVVVEAIAPQWSGVTVGPLKTLVARTTAQLFPDAVVAEIERNQRRRWLIKVAGSCGTDEWKAELPTERSALAWAAVTDAARKLVRDGDYESLTQARADALTDLILEHSDVKVVLHTTRPATDDELTSLSDGRPEASPRLGEQTVADKVIRSDCPAVSGRADSGPAEGSQSEAARAADGSRSGAAEVNAATSGPPTAAESAVSDDPGRHGPGQCDAAQDATATSVAADDGPGRDDPAQGNPTQGNPTQGDPAWGNPNPGGPTHGVAAQVPPGPAPARGVAAQVPHGPVPAHGVASQVPPDPAPTHARPGPTHGMAFESPEAAGGSGVDKGWCEVGGLGRTGTTFVPADLLEANPSTSVGAPLVASGSVLVCHPATGALIGGEVPVGLATGRRDVTRTSTQTSTTYRIPAAMVRFVRLRDGGCRFPGCTVPARQCDIDHVRPWPFGPTSPSNLHCLCRHHHQVKQRDGWSAQLQPDGTVIWRDPTGQTRITDAVDHLHLGSTKVASTESDNDAGSTDAATRQCSASRTTQRGSTSTCRRRGAAAMSPLEHDLHDQYLDAALHGRLLPLPPTDRYGRPVGRAAEFFDRHAQITVTTDLLPPEPEPDVIPF